MQEKQTINKLKKELQVSEEKYRELFENANIGIFQSTLEGKVISVNSTFAQMFGYESPEDLLIAVKKGTAELFADPQPWAEMIRTQSENPGRKTFENVYRRKDGSLFTGFQNVRRVNESASQPAHFEGFIQDISESKKSKGIIRKNAEQYRLLTENMKDVVWILDVETMCFRYVSPSVQKLRGYTAEEILSASIDYALTPGAGAGLKALFRQRAADFLSGEENPERFYTAEVEQPCKDGSTVWTEEITSYSLNTETGHVEVRGVTRDISARKQAEAALKKRNAEISLLYEASQALNRTLNPEELYQILNMFISKIMSNDGLFISAYERETELIRCVFAMDEHQQALDVSNFPPIPLEPKGRGTQSQVVRSGKPRLLNDYQAQMRSARAKYYIDENSQIFDVDSIPTDADVTRSALILPMLLEGQVVGVLQILSYRLNAYSQDDLRLAESLVTQFSVASNNALLYQKAQLEIAKHKRIEQNLQESEERYHQLFDLSPYPIIIHDGKTYQLANPATAKLLGVANQQELIGKPILSLVHPDSLETIKERVKSVFEGKPVPTLTEKFIRPDGRVLDINVTALPYSDKNIRGILTILNDITEQKKAVDALHRQNAYLAALQETMLELVSLYDLNILLENIVRRAGELLGTEAGFLDIVEPGTNQLKPQVGLGALAESLKFTLRPGEDVAGTVWQTGKTLVIDNYDTWKGQVKRSSRNKIQSIIGVPLLSGEQIVGVLGLAYTPLSNRTFGTEEIELLTQFARLATLAIENTRVLAALQQELAERKQAEAALQKSEASIRSIYQSMSEMLALHEIVYDPTGKAIDYRILDCNAAFTDITGIPQERAIGALASQLYSIGEAPYLEAYARVAETGETIHFESDFAPLKKNFSISAFSPEKGHFATITSDITRRKASEAEINRHLSELEVLYENGLAINQLLEPKQIGQKLMETLSQKLDWYHAAIRAIQPETGKLTLLAYSHPGFNNAEIEKEITRLNQLVTDTGKGLSGWVIKHGKPVRCAQVKKNKHYIEAYPGIQSGLYVPIQAGDRIIGSIAVESEQEDAFSEQDQRLLTTIASQAAISIQNAQLFLTAQQELAARKQAEQALLEAHAELEHRVVDATAEVQDLYNNAPCGYHSLDANGKFVHINKTELNWLGYQSQNIIGHPLKEFLTENSQALFAEKFPAFKRDGVLKDLELEFVCKNGFILPMLINATAIYDDSGAYKMSRSSTLDIFQRKLIEEALRESESRLRQNRDELSAANIALEKAAQMKDEFLASMSHELRTPLTGILGLSEALQLSTYGELSEKQLKALKNIESSGRHLLELINDILDLSKIEAGKFEIRMEPCSLTDICRASLQLAKGMAQQKHQEVSFSISPDSIYLRADARRLKQMLVNLLSNAVKFTPDGGSIGLEVLGNPNEQQVRLTVWDNGIGIKAEDLKNLFKPFVQLDSSLSRQYSGTGLGLSLVKRMTELQGGIVEVISVPAQGSRFTIILPWVIQDEASADTASTSTIRFTPIKEIGQDKPPALILVADDNEDILGMLSDFLQVEHFQVITTRSGRELLKRISEAHPDLLLIDIQMPGMDGLETIRQIRIHPDAKVATAPIIALTALAMPGDRERCLVAGANEYLSKPLQLVKLIAVIKEILHR